MLQVVPIGRSELALLTGDPIDMAVAAYAGIENERLIGLGGLAWGGGRCWLFLQVFEAASAFVVMRWARRMLAKAAQLGEVEVFTPRDRQFETSERLLTRLGFRFHTIENDEEIWVWRRSV